MRAHSSNYRVFRFSGQNGKVPALCRTSSLSRSGWRGPSGFSLVEVALAIGIVAVVFVALFGMLSPGLNIHRQAVDNSVGSQIVQSLFNEAQQTDFPVLILAKSTTRYFDNQGNEVGITDSQYTAEISVLPATRVPAADDRTTDSLATVTIKLANNPGHIPDPFASYSRVPYGIFFAYIAKSQ